MVRFPEGPLVVPEVLDEVPEPAARLLDPPVAPALPLPPHDGDPLGVPVGGRVAEGAVEVDRVDAVAVHLERQVRVRAVPVPLQLPRHRLARPVRVRHEALRRHRDAVDEPPPLHGPQLVARARQEVVEGDGLALVRLVVD